MVQILQRQRLVGEQGAVHPLADGLMQLLIGLKNAHGVVGALLIEPLHRVGTHSENVDVVLSHLIVNFHVGAVHGADGQRTVHHELHVTGAAGLLARRGELLADLGGGNEHLGGGYVVVLNVDDLDHLSGPGRCVDQLGQRIDVADDELGPHVAWGGLGAKEEQPGRHGEIGVVHDAVVKHLNVQGVEHLTLVLMQPLGLRIKDEVGVDVDALTILHQLLQALLVDLLDLIELFPEGSVIGKGRQLGQLLCVGAEAVADGFSNQRGQRRVGLQQPAAVGNAVGDGAELLLIQQVKVVEQGIAENLSVELAHAVNAEAHRHAQVRHMHLTVADDGHVADALPLVGIADEQVGAQAAV